MKVLLIDPFYNSGVVPPNWSLGQIEAGLKELGIDVSLIDFIEKDFKSGNLDNFIEKEEDFIRNIRKKVKNYDAVYITSSYGIPLKQMPVFPRIEKIVKNIKKVDTSIRVAVGGSNINYAKRMLNISPQTEIGNCLVDYFIYGDEAKVVDIFKTLFDIKKNINYTEKVITWDSWDFSKYPNYSSLITAKGCIFNCSFCFESKIFDRAYEKLNINYVIENIKFLINKKNINKFAIEDSSFLSNSDFEYFCDMVLKNKLNIRWSAYGRVDQILKYKSYLPKLYQAGCTNIILGVESSRDGMLKEMNKNCTSANTTEAINLLKKNRIGIQGCFILGFTGSTYKDIEETIDFGLGLNLNAYRWHIFQPNASNLKGANLSKKVTSNNDYLKIQLNVPDFCLPEILEAARNPSSILTEEHFLIRAIPYLSDKNKILSIVKHDDLLFSEIFRIIKSKLSTKFKNFNEEEMYKLI